MEILIWALAAWLIASPDRFTLALTRGAVGAAKGAAIAKATAPRATTSTATMSGGTSSGGTSSTGVKGRRAAKKSKTTARSRKAATGTAAVPDNEPVSVSLSGAAVAGWTQAAAAARARREAGTDTVGRTLRAGSSLRAAVVGARAAGGGLRARLRAGLDAGRGRWVATSVAGRAAAEQAAAESAAAIQDDGPVSVSSAEPAAHSLGAEGDRGRVARIAAAAAAALVAAEAAGHLNEATASGAQIPAEAGHSPSSATAGPTTEGDPTMKVTELESLTAVQSEAAAAQALCEALSEQIAQLKTWARLLPERWSGTNWATAGLNASVDSVAAASEQLTGADPISEALGQVRVACDKAKSVAEVADAVGATGDIGAFRAA
jgi:hypothetical protein